MANDVVSLLKIQLSEELRLGAIARRGNGSRDALTYLMSVVLVAVVFGFMMHMFMDSLTSAGYAEHVPLRIQGTCGEREMRCVRKMRRGLSGRRGETWAETVYKAR